jgi:DNA-binding NtrC family response regulator
MQSGHVIVCEATGHWAFALRQALSDTAAVAETRALEELAERLTASPTAVAVIEFRRSHCRQVLDWLAGCSRRFPRVLPLVVADRSSAGWADLFREAGAEDVVTSPRELAGLAASVRRHGERFPVPPQRMTERIMAELPWSKTR